MSVSTPAAEARRIEALDLRLAGASYRQIAAQLGVSVRTSFQDVQRALKATLQPAADEVRREEVLRLDRLLLAHWPASTRGDIAATNVALRIMERRARLLGLDVPVEKNDPAALPVAASALDELRARRERGA